MSQHKIISMRNDSLYLKIILVLALFLTVAIAVVKGGVHEWVNLVWVGLCAVSLYFAWVPTLSNLRQSGDLLEVLLDLKALVNKPLFFFVLFQIWALIQYFFIAPDKSASLNHLFLGFGMTFLLMLWAVAGKAKNVLNLLFYTLLCFSVIQAIYGFWVYLSGANLLLWMPKVYYLDRPTGFFVNGNHFATYTVLAIILCISSMLFKTEQLNRESFFLKVTEFIYSPKIIVLLFLFCALIASKSIGALTAFGVVLLFMFGHLLWRSKHWGKFLLAAIIILVFFTFILLSLDYSVIDNEVSLLSHTFSRRFALSSASMSMLKETWLWGLGGGGFYSQFSQYRTLDIGNSYYNFAHNDLIQFWIEYGVIGVILLGLFLLSALRANLAIFKKEHTAMQATFAYASIYSTIAIMVHSLVDFPMHIPGVSVCYLVIVSINCLTAKK